MIQGYELNLNCHPNQPRLPAELKFPQAVIKALTQEVQEMVNKQAVSQIPGEQTNKGFISQLFSVPKKRGMRPIINLKSLNTFVEKVLFKMEGIHMLKDTLKSGDWITKVNLKDAYFMIPLAPHHRCLLRFQYIVVNFLLTYACT